MLVTFLVSIALAAAMRVALGRWLADRDSALQWSLAGLAGLGLFGLVIFLSYSVALPTAAWAVGGLFVAAAVFTSVRKGLNREMLQIGAGSRLAIGIGLLPVLLSLIGAAAPSTTLDWDSLAYHLAVSKIWLNDGHTSFISYIHHSNFPLSIDSLFLFGMSYGGETGAKTFSVVLFALAIMGVFGLARETYGEKAALWAVAAYSTIPMAIWLSGTAYIDVAHGAYGGLGIFLLAQYMQDSSRKSNLILAGIMLGLAAGTKYTGLQTVGVAMLAGLFYLSSGKGSPLKLAIPLGLVVVISGAWYVRNIINTGNPVYPFFYSALKGKNWSDYNAKIYSNEQQTFGAGREMVENYTAGKLEPSRLGASVLGLAYQPGRYINPAPTQGSGLPMGAIGPVILVALLAWLASGRMGRREGYIAACSILMFLAWFALSQQSRYILTLAPPLAILAGGAIVQLSFGRILAVLVPLQAAFGLYFNYQFVVKDQLLVVGGRITPDEYRRATTAFAEPAAWINEHPSKRVALYDEVFGYLLNVPYFWANPGHTTELGYETMRTGDDLVDNLTRLGIDRVYVNTAFWPKAQTAAWLVDAGLANDGPGMTPEEKKSVFDELQVRWKPLLAEAIRSGRLVPENQIRRAFIFRVR